MEPVRTDLLLSPVYVLSRDLGLFSLFQYFFKDLLKRKIFNGQIDLRPAPA
jgi:hypothetical protein